MFIPIAYQNNIISVRKRIVSDRINTVPDEGIVKMVWTLLHRFTTSQHRYYANFFRYPPFCVLLSSSNQCYSYLACVCSVPVQFPSTIRDSSQHVRQCIHYRVVGRMEQIHSSCVKVRLLDRVFWIYIAFLPLKRKQYYLGMGKKSNCKDKWGAQKILYLSCEIPQLAVVGIVKSSKAKFKIVKSDEVWKNA